MKLLGESLYKNDTLARLDLSACDLLRGHSGIGINALLYAFRVNHSIRYVGLRNNKMDHFLAIDAAYALTFNKGVHELDLTGNPIGEQWLRPDTFIRTHILDKARRKP